MAQQTMQWSPIGMGRDMAASKFSSQYAYDIRNLRLNSSESGTAMCWVTEKGPKRVRISSGSLTQIAGIPIGTAVVADTLIVFVVSGNRNIIVAVNVEVSGEVTIKKLFMGNLGFDVEHPIECLPMYENENAVKVYWTDGINPPRVMNIAPFLKNDRNNDFSFPSDSDQFNFIPKLNFNENVTIQRDLASSGLFGQGVIQYAFTYFRKFGSETNIFYVSDLHYISFNGRGCSPEDTVSNSFSIIVENADTQHFDYMRIYSIHRSSLDATPMVRRVVDIDLSTLINNRVRFTDTGEYGDTVDPTLLLYIGGKNITVGTMEQKDNTLFLGNIQTKSILVNDLIKKNINKFDQLASHTQIEFVHDENKSFSEGSAINKTYAYRSRLDKSSSKLTTFKFGEIYRFGIQAQKDTGEWSEPIFLRDAENTVKPLISSGSTKTYTPVKASSVLQYRKIENGVEKSGDHKSLIDLLIDNGYVNIRPMVAFPSIAERKVLCQGVLCPTVFNGIDRKTNSPGAQSSWFFRPLPKPNGSGSVSEANFENTTTPSANYIYGLFIINYPGGSQFKNAVKTGNTVTFTRENYNNQVSVKVLGTTESNITKTGIYSGPALFMLVQSNEDITSFLRDSDGAITLVTGGGFNSYVCAYSVPYNFSTYTSGSSIFVAGFQNEVVPVEPENEDPFARYKYNDLIIASTETQSRTISGTLTKVFATGRDPRAPMINSIKIDFVRDSPTLGTELPGNEIQWSHNMSLYMTSFGAEIQSNVYAEGDIINAVTYNSSLDNTKSDYFFVDQSVVTFHSPDIEFDSRMGSIDNNDGYQFNIVGVVPITSTIGDMNLTTSTAPFSTNKTAGFSRKKVGSVNISAEGYKGMATVASWNDMIFKGGREGFSGNAAFPIYPWHRSGSLNNQSVGWDLSEGTGKEGGDNKYSVLKRKKMSNLRYSYFPIYTSHNDYTFPISDMKVFNSNEVTNTKVGDINYYGNVDKVIFVVRDTKFFEGKDTNLSTSGYQLFRSNSSLTGFGSLSTAFGGELPYNAYSSDPISMKYKSGIHAVAKVNSPLTSRMSGIEGDTHVGYGYLMLADLINTKIVSRDSSESAIQNTQWLIGGKPVPLVRDNVTLDWTEGDTYLQRYDCLKTYPFTMEDTNSIVDILSFMCETRINIDGRYDKNRGLTDNLVMHPAIFNLINPVYSQKNNFFNYRVLDNDLFNYESYPYTVAWTKSKTMGEKIDTWTNVTLANVLDMDGQNGTIRAIRRFNESLFVFQDKGISQILYNENMQLGTTEGVPIEIGNSGKVTGKRYISDKIGCNNKWSICTTPSAIYFVDGINKDIYRLGEGLENISTQGGMNSWIKEQELLRQWNPSDFDGIVSHYDYKNSEVMFITKDTCLNYSEAFRAFTSFYDYRHSPWFNTVSGKQLWLQIQTANETDFSLWNGNCNYYLWEHNAGDYNNFFGKALDYGMTLVANENPMTDKIFDSVEFIADTLYESTLVQERKEVLLNIYPFDNIRVWNEYQDTHDVPLVNIYGRPSNLKQKFRIWRALVPRDTYVTPGGITKQERIRNPWAYIHLYKTNPQNAKTIIHNLSCRYTSN